MATEASIDAMGSADAMLAQKYQKKTDKQHVLDNPDTYTGSMELTEYDTFIYDNDANKIVAKLIQIIPGLYKLFDESAVNASDHSKRMAQLAKSTTDKSDINPVTYINFTIDQDGTISVENDGNGIDIAKHPEEDIWIPEMIFGHLRTSTNYNKDEKKIVGGKNGFGIKLVFIWSTWGKVETIDHTRKLMYTQEFHDNLNVIKPPSVTKCTKKPYTKITFKPDFKRLGIDGFSPDMLALLKRRVFDIAAITEKNIKVRFNGELVPVKHFQQYVDMYIGTKDDAPRIYEEANDRWEYVVALAPKEEFTQVSFVNGIFTGKGGKHVDYITNQIIRKLTAFIKQKKKVDVKPNTIKEQLMLFVRCDIENPSFDSQTKDYMTTPVSSFGSSCEVSDKFIEKIAKMGVMDAACALTEVKEHKAAKKTDGTKSKNVRGIPKLTDANFAGTAKSHECTLILCEGDSAKSGVISGLSSEDRNTIGVYPMRGKMLNVRDSAITRVMENKEISEIKQILGLETGKKYCAESVKKDLRYGKVVFMTDQDLDGSHIKGLGINLFDSLWETLTEIPGFLGFMNTPIIKARKGTGKNKEEKLFYNDGQYRQWKEDESIDTKGWSVKYYKGLGTSDAKEFKEYFKHKRFIEFTSTGQESKDAIDKAFNKKRADNRKTWLEQYNRDLYLDTNKQEVSYQDFINNELIHFSVYDCERNIPNLIDGNKISQRKVLYSAFKRNQTKEVKVAQFSAATAELSHYHHGEDSLNQTIVNMAQNFVGSNNINVLMPLGQFGTRLQGGKDSASPRYITTKLNKLTRLIFPEHDDKVLTYLEDDGHPVEPMFYVPIIPMILVNGSVGIGTGFSTDIMCYNPLDLINYMKASLSGNALETQSMQINPYYQGFKGEIKPIGESKYLIKGCYKVLNDKQVQITELPIGTWTEDYKHFLEDLLQFEYNEEDGADGKKKRRGSVSSVSSDTKKASTKAKASKTASAPPPKPKGSCPVKDYVDMSTDVSVDFTITFAPGFINKLIGMKGDHDCNGLEKFLKLYTTNTNTNMHMFDEHEKLVKYSNVKEIIDHFMKVRFKTYEARKAYQVEALAKELMVLSNKARFITEILDETIDLRKKKSEVISAMLKEKCYDQIDDDKDYKYLVKMPMDSVSEENVKRILNEREKKQAELDELKATTEKQIWLSELDKLQAEYSNKAENDADEDTEDAEAEDNAKEKKSPSKKVVKKVITKKKIKVVEG